MANSKPTKSPAKKEDSQKDTTSSLTKPESKPQCATPKSLNIYQRMIKIMQHVTYLQKLPVPGQSYNALRHDDVTMAVRVACIKYGVYLSIQTLENETSIIERGTQQLHYTKLVIAIEWINVDDPDAKDSKGVYTQRIFQTFVGHGEQRDCKSPGSAYSFAVKNAMLKAFSIPGGDDEEAPVGYAKAVERTKPEVKGAKLRTAEEWVQKQCDKNGWVYDDVLVWVEAVHGIKFEDMEVDALSNTMSSMLSQYRQGASEDPEGESYENG